jgi:hypothetical protein
MVGKAPILVISWEHGFAYKFPQLSQMVDTKQTGIR